MLAIMPAAAQERPNFSGEWVRVEPPKIHQPCSPLCRPTSPSRSGHYPCRDHGQEDTDSARVKGGVAGISAEPELASELPQCGRTRHSWSATSAQLHKTATQDIRQATRRCGRLIAAANWCRHHRPGEWSRTDHDAVRLSQAALNVSSNRAMSGLLRIVACVALAVTITSGQQSPNFAGEWVLIEPSIDPPSVLTVVQDKQTIRIETRSSGDRGPSSGTYRTVDGMVGPVSGRPQRCPVVVEGRHARHHLRGRPNDSRSDLARSVVT